MAYTDEQTNEAIAKLESGGDTTAKNPNSSATGKYQFIKSTFEGVKRNNPNLPSLSWDEFRTNPDAQEQYQQALVNENTSALQRNKLEVTPANQYIVHFAGAPKGTAILKANDDEKLNAYLGKNAMTANKFTDDMTVGDFKGYIGYKMDKALGKGQDQIMLAAKQKEFRDPVVTPQHELQLAALDATTQAIGQAQTPEARLALADEVNANMKDFGPSWGNALIATLLGQKEQAYVQVTGGRIHAPQIGEALIGGQLKQINIMTNDRGDQWFEDPNTGKRLPDNTRILSKSPEGSIGYGRTREQIEATGKGPASQGMFTKTENARHTVEQENIDLRQRELETEDKNLATIHEGTRQFGDALNNAARGGFGEAGLKLLKAIKSGSTDEKTMAEAMTLFKIKPEDRGPFAAYMRAIDESNKTEAAAKGMHAPGSGTHGIVDLSGGAEGVKEWIARKSASNLNQRGWQQFYDERKGSKTVSAIRSEWENSKDYKALRNLEAWQIARVSGKKPELSNGAPIAVKQRDGSVVIKAYNAKTGGVE